MTYKEFKATVWPNRNAPQALAMSAPSEARQRIEAKQAAIKAQLDAKLAAKTN